MGMPPTLPNIPDVQPSQHWWIKVIPRSYLDYSKYIE